MVRSVISMDQLKALWHSEVHNEQKWAHSYRSTSQSDTTYF
ncbi:unnamed protein product [Brassica rapa subsp. trilocularis]